MPKSIVSLVFREYVCICAQESRVCDAVRVVLCMKIKLLIASNVGQCARTYATVYIKRRHWQSTAFIMNITINLDISHNTSIRSIISQFLMECWPQIKRLLLTVNVLIYRCTIASNQVRTLCWWRDVIRYTYGGFNEKFD